MSEHLLIISVFSIGYLAIIFENYLKINKTAIALLMAVISWGIFFFVEPNGSQTNIYQLTQHLGNISQIIFFILGAMTLVEVIDCHKGFNIITKFIKTRSKRKMLWLIGGFSFFISAILDNLTTTIVIVSMLRKIIPKREDRWLLGSVVVIAANAGGAWTPIGDVTTTMLWIHGHVTTLAVMRSLFLPSLFSLVVSMSLFNFLIKGKREESFIPTGNILPEPGAHLVFILGVLALVFVPIFKALTGLPPFMGVLIGLGVLWVVTDILHSHHDERCHLRVPYILTKVDISGVLFFLGILLAIDAMEIVGILKNLATWLDTHMPSWPLIATSIGFLSAIVDNVPLVAASMGMYDLSVLPPNSPAWLMIAYAAGTGGSILIIGSAAGVAFMGLEKVDFLWYVKKISLIALVGYLAGMGLYLVMRAL